MTFFFIFQNDKSNNFIKFDNQEWNSLYFVSLVWIRSELQCWFYFGGNLIHCQAKPYI